MSTTRKYEPATNTPTVPAPTCPHCEGELLTLSLFTWVIGPWIIMSTYCPHQECRALLHTQVVPGAVQQESKIEMPS